VRQMVLVGFLQAQNCTTLASSWRHPESRTDFTTAAYFQRIGAVMEAGKFQLAFFDDQIQNSGFLQHLDALALLHPLDQGARDLGASLIAVRVDDPASGVRGLAPELEVSTRLEVKVRAGCRQLSHSRRPFFDQDFHRLGIAERGTGSEW